MVVSVNYRLAPEHSYPAPIEDCYAALKWIAPNAETLNVDSNRIGVAGVNAGSGLTAAFSPIINEPDEDVAANYTLINKLVTSFFDQNLKGINKNHLEEIQKQYPELHLIKH